MRTINIPDKTYFELQLLLKKIEINEIKEYGYVICKTPEDVIPWLIGYYKGQHEKD
jgi:hypothetical protein